MHVFLIAAITTDGFIAQHPDQASTSWTSGADKKFFTQKTKEAQVMILGRTTQETIGRALPGRLTVVMSRSGKPLKLIELKDIGDGKVIVTNDAPEVILRKLEKTGFEQAAICGGASVYTQFVKADLVNRLYLTVEPMLMGQGISLFTEPLELKLSVIKEEFLNKQGTRLIVFVVSSESSL